MTTNQSSQNRFSRLQRYASPIGWAIALIAAVVVAILTFPQWKPYAVTAVNYIRNVKHETEDDHAATADTTPDTLKLSDAAWKNIGLVTGVVEPSDFVKQISVPAIVVERPGRSQTRITSQMTGIVTEVHPLEREVVEPGTPLFELRLTHEDVVSSQSEFLTELQNLDVAQRELTRLERIPDGVVAGKLLFQQRSERDRARGTVSALRQALILHGFSRQQVASIEKNRQVIGTFTVVAPPFTDRHEHADFDHQYHVQSINVKRGEAVSAGQLLGTVADHCLLYVEGKAFEGDALRLENARSEGVAVTVIPDSSGNADGALSLNVQSVSDQIDTQSRVLHFYLLLPNQQAARRRVSRPSNSQTSSSQASNIVAANDFASWKYRPGQRMEVLIPTSRKMKNKIVLPPDAVVIDGPNAFVFEQNGNNFDRKDVQVLYRDKDSVVLENDGMLVGSTIALNGAFQMHLALKNQAGGAVDPHAGHSH